MSYLEHRRADGEGQRATTLELFYDLVFVFAITQVSHLLLEHLAWAVVGQSLLVLLVVWWSWNYTTWVTNELDAESISVRLLMIALMLASLLMAAAIPEAFGDRALLFAGSYVAIQLGRHLFLTFVAAESGTREPAGRILAWFVAAGVLWISGALVEGEARVALWSAALALDYGTPLIFFWVPGRPRLAGATWNVGTEHFAERFQLFIIALVRPSSSLARPSRTSNWIRPGSPRSEWRSSRPSRCGGPTSTTSRRPRNVRCGRDPAQGEPAPLERLEAPAARHGQGS